MLLRPRSKVFPLERQRRAGIHIGIADAPLGQFLAETFWLLGQHRKSAVMMGNRILCLDGRRRARTLEFHDGG